MLVLMTKFTMMNGKCFRMSTLRFSRSGNSAFHGMVNRGRKGCDCRIVFVATVHSGLVRSRQLLFVTPIIS
jgi:hypothetical protein